MRIFLLLTAFLLLSRITAEAQKKNVAWRNNFSAALLNGDKYTSVAVTAVTGIQVAQWYVGVGTGIDYYKVRSLPLLAEVRFESRMKLSPFVYARGGYNVAWALDHQHTKLYGYYQLNSVYNNGRYAAAGAGLYLYKKGSSGVTCAMGYSTKGVSELYDEYQWNGRETVATHKKLDYVFRRLDLSIAYRF